MSKEESKPKKSEYQELLDAIKEMTTVLADNTKVLNKMYEAHTKWIKAGKF